MLNDSYMDKKDSEVYEEIKKALELKGLSLSNFYSTGDGATLLVNHQGKRYRLYLSNTDPLDVVINDYQDLD